MVVLARVGRSLRRIWHAEHSLSARARGLDRMMDVVLAAGMVLFAMGITLPVMTVTELWVFENEFSIVGGIVKLWSEGEAQIGRAHAELQSRLGISYAVFCLKKKNKNATGQSERDCRDAK